ncbi:MAG TPA: HAD-IA family hydrolase [Solirubrobacteraceae bacterium]
MTERNPYRGLLVDWGGVMTTNVFHSFHAYCEAAGIDPDAVGERFRSDPDSRELLIGLETGAMPEDEFERRFGAILGVPGEGLIARLFAGGRPDEAMQNAVRAARAAGVRTGLISNSWGTGRYDRTLLAELFHGIVISGEVGMRKPTPDIYLLGARAIESEPDVCVFVDDLKFNLAPARELGMATVLHVDATETIDELERLLAVDLRLG